MSVADKSTETLKYEMYFFYDSNNRLASLKYFLYSNGVASEYTYYAATNFFGDVVRLYGGDGVIRASYEYDAWGNVVAVKNADGTLNENLNALANRNPIRYRGYVYDTDTELYYLQSRYYNPEIGRFLNADGQLNSDMLGCNMFSYCSNNPVSYYDPTGHFWDTALDIVSLAFSIYDVAKNPKSGWAWASLAADVVSLVVPFATGGGVIIKGLKAANKVDNFVDVGKTIDNVNDVASTAQNLHRPYIRKATRQAVEAKAPKLADGRFIDPNLGTAINGKYDLGHVHGHEFHHERKLAMEKGWTQKEFNDYMNNPDFYQIEDPSSNRSHKFEKKWD